MSSKHKQCQNKSQQLFKFLRKLSWFLVFHVTISYQGENWKIELKYQPRLQTKPVIEMIQKLVQPSINRQ